jgi:hypothetical protein
LNEYVNHLNNINQIALEGRNADAHIKNSLNFMGIQMNKSHLIHLANTQKLDSDIAIATYLSYKFARIQLTIQSSLGENGLFHITSEFLEMMNTTLPCNSNCPIELSTIINCHIDVYKNSIQFGIISRKPSNNILILEAKPFILYKTNGKLNCFITYNGPAFVFFDNLTRCVQPVSKYDTLLYVLYTQKYINYTSKPFESIKWNDTHCSVENEFEEIQIIYGNDYNYIYCYENNITIKSRMFECPDQPFKLKTDTSFRVNSFTYYSVSNQNKPIINESYLWSQQTNEFLSKIKNNISIDLKDFYNELNDVNIKDVINYKSHTKYTLFSISGCLIIIIILIIIYSVIKIVLIKRRNRNLNNLRDRIVYETARGLAEVISQSRPQTPSLEGSRSMLY